jgi:hypothetical protein
LVLGKDHTTGEAAKTPTDGARDMSKEEGTDKELTSSTTSWSLERQRSSDSFTSMMAEKLDKFTEAIRDEAPKGPTSKEIFRWRHIFRLVWYLNRWCAQVRVLIGTSIDSKEEMAVEAT